MGERIICALHDEVISGIKSDIIEIKAENRTIGEKLEDLHEALNAAVVKILVWLTILFGSAAVALILYIVTDHIQHSKP